MLPNLLMSVIVTTLLWNFLSSATAGLTKPNFVFIITDDQDLHLESLAYQPSVRKRMGEEGTFFSKHYCTVALCCPSRVSLLTGKMAHNTNVTDIAPPYGIYSSREYISIHFLTHNVGGYPKFITQGLNDNYLPVWLQDAGYNTYYTGKLMNAHSIATYNKPFPRGWNGTGCK
jgi:N-acetylglucosamine-6-sulfatase